MIGGRNNTENFMIVVRCSSGINHIFVHATHYPSLPLSSAFCTHSCLVFRPHNLIFHSNRFTCSLPSPFLLSFSLLPFLCSSLGLSFHPWSPSSPPILICSSLAEGEEKERVFPQVSCIQSVGVTCGRQREKDDWRAVLWTKQIKDWYRERGFGVIEEKGKKLFLGRLVSLFLVWSFISVCKKIVYSEQIQTLCIAINLKSYA